MFRQARSEISLAPLLTEEPQSPLRGACPAPRLHFPGDPTARFRGDTAARPSAGGRGRGAGARCGRGSLRGRAFGVNLPAVWA